MNKRKNNKNLSQEKLLAEIDRLKKELKKRKKYGLTWEGEKNPEEVVEMCKENLPVLKELKNKAIITNKDKSVSLLIESDNYHSLSVLNYTHAKKVDVIYIDPPYNTGNKDFIFNDNYVDREDAYRHSKWLAFMAKRLRLAKNLLKNNGVIFISIDDNEQAQLKLLCDEILGEKNFIANFVWKKTENIKMDSRHVSINKDYILCYQRGGRSDFNKRLSDLSRFKLKDKKGRYYLRKLDSKSSSYSKGMDYVIEHNGVKYYAGGSFKKYKLRKEKGANRKDAIWLWSKKKFKEGLKDGEIVFKNGNVYNKIRYDGIAKKPYIDIIDFVSVQTAQKELDRLFGSRKFDHPKPVLLIKHLLKMVIGKNSIVLDFMAGTGTTGQAVLELNKEDGGNRKFILCTNNENNICTDVCYPRVKKAITGYRNLEGEKIAGLGGNLRYFKTNFVGAEPTDSNKVKLTEQAAEMLCIKEGTFETIINNKRFKIFKNFNHYTGIIFDQAAIPAFKKAIKDIKGEFTIYVFSLGDEAFNDEFEDIKQKVQLSPIPEAILRVYRRIFK